jgi:hypothetical protein
VFGCPFFTGLEGEENVGIAENFSLVKGRHQLKFGAQGNQVRTILNATNGHDGYWWFPLDLAFDINNPSSYPFAFGRNTGVSRSQTHLWNYYFYVQDNWQIGRKINLNLGLRYDLDLSVTAGNDYVNGKNRQIIQRHGGGPLLQKTNVDKDNLAPRVGIVWSPGSEQKTLVRGAAGIFYDQNHNNFNYINIQNTLLSDGFGVLNAYDPLSNPLGSPEALQLLLAQSFPYFPDIPGTIPTNEVIYRNDPNLKVPYTVQYSGGLTHDFGSGLSAQADIVHVHGIGNPLYIDDNISSVNGESVRVDPRFAAIQTLKNWGWTRYNALLMQLQYLGSREHLGVAYTLSKTTSKVNSSIFGASPGNPLDLSADVGPDDTDRRHNLVVNGYWRLPLNFQIAGIWTYRSAPPYSVFSMFLIGQNLATRGEATHSTVQT